MAYFTSNEPSSEDQHPSEDLRDEDYDDGFDELTEDGEEPEPDEEERAERRRNRIMLAFGASNLLVVVAGTVLILLLLTLIFSMVHFIYIDMGRNFSLFQTQF